MSTKWLTWATEIQSIAQAGLTYSKDKYDIERFEQLKGIAAQIISEYTEIEFKKVKDLLDKETGYQTPKVDVRGAIIKNDKILLVKESLDGKWSMPGGWADINLSVSENIIKEASEEAGVNVIPKKIVGVLDSSKLNTQNSLYSIYKIIVLCEFVDGEFEDNIETEESKFFALDNLPELSTCRNTKEQIEMCFKAYYDKAVETIFD